MIREVKIQNYKSIESLDLELGRINVLIGENGCGKTNILEAIALASAAYSNKLDNEFLVSRGIRVTEPQLMRSAFEKENIVKEIEIEIIPENATTLKLILTNKNELYSKWYSHAVDIKSGKTLFTPLEEWKEGLEYHNLQLKKLVASGISKKDKKNNRIKVEKNDITKAIESIENLLGDIGKAKETPYFLNFILFYPNHSSLRIFEEEGQIQPLGTRGEGLFKFLRFLDMKEDKTRFKEIKERLRLISWFKDFEIPKDLFETERKIHIFDKYLDPELKYFDQRSSNEGFLFILFHFALFVGEETPKFFAIDNIDNSLNPKLCWRVVEELVELAQKYDKQAIFTTHNPAILDGLDLHDDEQRLFVVSRNKFGRTRVRRIFSPKKIEGQEPVRLSEAFLRGYIGGMPQNF
ncbi:MULTISPECIES: AAA family ATPase [Spirulina sp. CCY15215]|uniref:AAA family ATPase n=1 Tax=Spirulina sp. CCY15215 TaxID=2767591 RepID=UPI001EF1A401|nr:AAA family ATPase [Spirulina major]